MLQRCKHYGSKGFRSIHSSRKTESRGEYGDIFEDKTHGKQPKGLRRRDGHVNAKKKKKKNSNNETTIMRSEICKELKEEMPRKAYQIERETNEIIVQNKVN